MFALLSMWFGISLPLVFLGYFFGFRKMVSVSSSSTINLLIFNLFFWCVALFVSNSGILIIIIVIVIVIIIMMLKILD